MVTLPQMPPDVWDAWRSASIRRYASDMIRVGAWPAEGPEARADLYRAVGFAETDVSVIKRLAGNPASSL